MYTSDWAAAYVAASFPYAATFFSKSGTGTGYFICNVVDEGIKDYIGSSIVQINIDLGNWVSIKEIPKTTREYLRAQDNPSYYDYVRNRPMLISFKYGKGTVIYTTFHNHAQVSQTENSLLEYMVLMSVTSRLADQLAEYMQQKGYIVARESINRIQQSQASISYYYSHTAGSNYDLCFGVNFENATLEIFVYSDGVLYKTLSNTSGPFMIEAPKTSNGTWTYRIRSSAQSQVNLPYVVMVGRRTAAFNNLDNVVVAPNPFIPSEGHETIVFDKLTSETIIKIFSIDGKLLKTFPPPYSGSGSVFWNSTTDDGEKIVTGTYIYLMTTPYGEKKKGKISIIR